MLTMIREVFNNNTKYENEEGGHKIKEVPDINHFDVGSRRELVRDGLWCNVLDEKCNGK